MTREITDALIASYRRNGWRAEREALFSPRRIDVMAISPGGRDIVAFEVKISRADFKTELRDPAKRLSVMHHCSQFYFVTPYQLIEPSDVPEGCGLIYYVVHSFLVVKRSPMDKGELPFETECRTAYEAWIKRSNDSELDAIKLERLESEANIDYIDFLQTPGWMLPRFVRPLYFQSDVIITASKIPAALLPDFSIDFEAVPF